jgi:hypothetical protein
MIRIITSTISLKELKDMAELWCGQLVKAVVDVERKIMAVGGEMHADEEQVLLQDGSKQENLWGLNIYPAKDSKNRIEFDSMINVRPGQHNMSRSVEDEKLQKKIRFIVDQMITN